MRDETRHPISIQVTYTLEEEPHTHKDTLKNISEGGICIVAKEYIDIGTEIEAQLTIGNINYTLCGLIVWCKESYEEEECYEAGIQFDPDTLDIAPEIVAKVCQLVDYQKDIEILENRSITLEEAALEIITGEKGNE